MANVPLGYYVHHDGSGHMMRALAIVQNMNVPVVLFSSRKPHQPVPPHVTFIELPDDAVGEYSQPQSSLFLYTPYADTILSRYQQLIAAIRQHQIQAMYVDVSPEIALICKLLGLRVGHAVMHGTRTDQAHSLLYDAVDVLLSHNATSFDNPLNRQSRTPVQYSGGISRLPKYATPLPVSISHILVTVSRASSALSLTDVINSARQFPHIQWDVIGAVASHDDIPSNLRVHSVVDDVISFYRRADMVIGAGGNNTIMEAASQRKPFICIPEEKPFNEQGEAACILAQRNMAFYEQSWPSASRLQDICDSYHSLDLDAFYGLVDDNAAARAADIIQSLHETERALSHSSSGADE